MRKPCYETYLLQQPKVGVWKEHLLTYIKDLDETESEKALRVLKRDFEQVLSWDAVTPGFYEVSTLCSQERTIIEVTKAQPPIKWDRYQVSVIGSSVRKSVSDARREMFLVKRLEVE